MENITIGIPDDHTMVRQSLIIALSTEPFIKYISDVGYMVIKDLSLT